MNSNDLKVETSTLCGHPSEGPGSAELNTMHSPPLPGYEGVNSGKSGNEQETIEEKFEQQTKEETEEKLSLESLILDDLSDDEVNEKYKDHPGYPRDAASRERYYKYVYPDQSNLYENVRKKDRKYYRVRDHKEYRESPYLGYRGFVIHWFDEDWNRYPKILTDEEFESLEPVVKSRYLTFCQQVNCPGQPPDNTIWYRANRIEWNTLHQSYKATGEFKFMKF